jgi:hypothetical protein
MAPKPDSASFYEQAGQVNNDKFFAMASKGRANTIGVNKKLNRKNLNHGMSGASLGGE